MLISVVAVNSRLRLGESALYSKAPSDVRDSYRILNWVIVAGGLEGDTRFRGELTLVATYGLHF